MKRVILVITLLAAFFLGACSANTVIAEQTRPIKIWFENENGKYETLCIVDEETGVNYIVVGGELYQEGIGIAITPRLNADGSLYVEE